MPLIKLGWVSLTRSKSLRLQQGKVFANLASIRLSLEMCVTTKIMVHKHVARLPVRAAAVTGCSREGASLTPRFNDVASITQNAVWSWPGPALRRQEAPVMWWRRRATLPALAHLATVGAVKNAVRASERDRG